MPFLQASPEIIPGQGGQPPALPHGQTGLDASQNVSPTNVTPGHIPTYLELIYNDTPPPVGDGYEIPRAFPLGGVISKTLSSEAVDRPRTHSTSSTLSDGSASTPVLYQHNLLSCNKAVESKSTGKMGSILVIGNVKSNGCIGGLRKNATDLRRNGEKDLSSLEKLLPSVMECTNTVNNHQSVTGCVVDNKGGVNNNINTNSAYSNVVKQPLLEEQLRQKSLENPHNCSNDKNESTFTVSLNYMPTTTLS
jgi:hypothetical protein